MSDDSMAQPTSLGEMQFDRAELAQPTEGPKCEVCGTPLGGHYFQLNEKMACERCRYEVETAFNQGGGAGGFLKAALAGLGVAAAGSILYYAVREGTGYEFGLIAILVGYAVGRAVRWGSRAKGGWVFQGLAVFLTYMAIVSTYIPAIIEAVHKEVAKEMTAVTASASPSHTAQPVARGAAAPAATAASEELSLGGALLGVGALFAFAMAVPFLAGFENLIGIAIIAFGLYEAWKLNRRTTLAISGPFQIDAAPATAANP
jgi:hypothetical protein